MKIKTAVDEKLSACGNWPANLIADIQTVRGKMHENDFVGTPVFMIANPAIMEILGNVLPHSDTSYGQFLGRNKLIEDFHTIRFNEINLEKDSALFYTYSIGLSNFPEVELGVYTIEITNIDSHSLQGSAKDG
jgi:hypothetical protein